METTQQQVRVDMKDMETIKCEECGNGLFIQSFMLKRVSAIVSPSGKEEIIPVQMFTCFNCGSTPNKFLQAAGMGTTEEK